MRRRAPRKAAPVAIALLGGVVGLAGVTGCRAAQREIVVFFTNDATPAQHESALHECTGVAPHTSPEPIIAGTHRIARTSDVRFRIDNANDHDIALLEKCLQRQPGVIGVQDTMDTT